MADELDTEPTSSTPDPESPRAPYLAVLRRHRDAGTLSETEYDSRVADVADAATYGDLETALVDLDRDELPVATKRRQRRELPVEETAPVTAAGTDDAPAAEDDEFVADDDLVEDDPVVEDDDAEDDELVALDDETTDDDTSDDDDPADDDAVTDEADTDDVGDDDRELVTAGATSPRGATGSGGSVARRSRSDRTPAAQGKGRPTRTRKEATSTTPERTGPITFIKESVGELRKVVYPSGQQLRNYFVVVLVFVLFIIGVTSGLDLAFGQLVLQVFGR